MKPIHVFIASILAGTSLVGFAMNCGQMEEQMISTIEPKDLNGFLDQARAISIFEERKLAEVEVVIRDKVEAHERWVAENLTPLASRMEELKAKTTGDLRRDFDVKIAPVLQRRAENAAAMDRSVALIERTKERLRSITAKTSVINLWFRSLIGRNTSESLQWQAARNLLRKYEGKKRTAYEQLQAAIKEFDNSKDALADRERVALRELDKSLESLQKEAETRQSQAFAERIAADKEVSAKRDALAKEIEAYIEQELGVAQRLNAAIKTLYEAVCQADSCERKIQSARRAVSSAQVTEAIDLFSNNKVVSILSTMSTSSASSEISYVERYLNELSTHVSRAKKALAELGKGQVDTAEFSGVVQVSDFLDLIVDTAWNPQVDFTSIAGFVQLGRADGSLRQAANEVEAVRKDLSNMKGKLETSLAEYNSSMKQVASQIVREEIQRKN